MADFEFRRVVASDIAFCWPIYRDSMQKLTAELQGWDEPAQRKAIEEALADDNSSILMAANSDAGWLHVEETRREIYLTHLYLDPAARNRGLGSKFLRWMAERAQRKNKSFIVEVLKNCRARSLYERVGFRAVGTSGVAVRMEHQGGA